MKCSPPGCQVVSVDQNMMDICDMSAVLWVTNDLRADVIINTAAYTAVDRAENDVEQAYAVNRQGVVHLSNVSTKIGARLIHLSTDFVLMVVSLTLTGLMTSLSH